MRTSSSIWATRAETASAFKMVFLARSPNRPPSNLRACSAAGFKLSKSRPYPDSSSSKTRVSAYRSSNTPCILPISPSMACASAVSRAAVWASLSCVFTCVATARSFLSIRSNVFRCFLDNPNRAVSISSYCFSTRRTSEVIFSTLNMGKMSEVRRLKCSIRISRPIPTFHFSASTLKSFSYKGRP